MKMTSILHLVLVSIQSFLIFVVSIYTVRIMALSQRQNTVRKRSLNKELIFTLFVTHTLQGLTRFIYEILLFRFDYYNVAASIFGYGQYFLSGLEIGFILMITLERYVTVRFPLEFEIKKNLYRKIYFVTPFVVTFTAFSVSFYDPEVAWFLSIVVGIIIILTNVLLYRIVSEQTRRICLFVVHPDQSTQTKIRKKWRRRQNRAFKICFLLTFSYVMLWIPYLTVRNFIPFTSTTWLVFDFLAYLNPIIDAFIYLRWNSIGLRLRLK